ncbi:MAG: TraB/GumN family protein [Alteraurantiacibacter sp.]
MMLRLLTGLVAALALAACTAEKPAQDWPEPSPALWHVTGPDGAEGWLFGTIHALPEGVAWETPLVEQAFARADVLVVEVADLADGETAAAAFAQRASSPGLAPLTDRVPATDRALVVSMLNQANRSETDFAQTETWAAALQLAGGERLGDPALGVDRALLARGLPVQGLEGFTAQFDIFDRLPPDEQADLLVAVARETQAADPDADLRAWLTGDLATLQQRAFGGMLGDAELRTALLDDRNRAWLTRITALLGSGRKPFVAVGAVHMLGDTGLPALLAARGYTVTRIQ